MAMNNKRKPGYVAGGVAIVLLGCFVLWCGITAPPGEPAIHLPKTGTWSRTDALMVGVAFWALGAYTIVKFSKRQ